jgi:hypothetical protein
MNKSAMTELSDEEVAKRRDDAMRRALSTPPKSSKEMLGKTERAQAQRQTKAIRKTQAKPKSDAAS